MPYKVVRFQPTPNPNALKCILETAMPEPIRSYRSAAEADGDPVGQALFAVAGVAGLLIAGEWMTVNKSPEAEWGAVKSGVERALERV